MYGYAFSDPINFVDSTGNAIDGTCFGVCVTIGIGGGVTIGTLTGGGLGAILTGELGPA